MPEKKKFTLPPYVMLMLVSILMSFAIAGVYSVTKDTIEAAALEAQAAARSAVMEGAASMAELPLAEGDPVDYAYEAYDEAGNIVGYVSQITVVGFGGEIEVTVGLGADGAITGVSVGGKDFSETSGLGAKTREPAFTEQFRGMSGMLVLKQNIDSVTGASISSGAVVSGVNKAVAYMTALLPEGTAAGDGEPLPLTDEQIQELLPGAENVVWMGGGAGINGWWRADNGYIVRATGFGEGPIVVTMGFDNDGVVTGIIIGDENFMETEGRGDRVLEEWYKAQFLGKSGAQTYGEGIDAISGATVTSDATLAAINACMSFDPADPGTAAPAQAPTAEPDGVTEASVPEEASAEPDAVTEASILEEEPSAEPDAVTEASVPEEESVPAPTATPDGVTEASIPEEESTAGAVSPVVTPSPAFVPVTPSPAFDPAPAATPDAVTEASIPEEETVPAPTATPRSAQPRATSLPFLLPQPAATPDAVTEASIPEEEITPTPVPTPDAVTEASITD